MVGHVVGRIKTEKLIEGDLENLTTGQNTDFEIVVDSDRQEVLIIRKQA